jgi:hypothetical protein
MRSINFKMQTLLHVGAKTDAEEAVRVLVGDRVIIDELVRRDYKGDTPVHKAAKNGSV